MTPGGTLETAPAATATMSHGPPYDGFAVSSNGQDASTGVLWQTTMENVDQPGPGTLRAYLATDVSQELWNSDMNRLRDGLGTFVKFCNPTVANGKVYAATSSGQVAVYGLFAADGAHDHACTDKPMRAGEWFLKTPERARCDTPADRIVP